MKYIDYDSILIGRGPQDLSKPILFKNPGIINSATRTTGINTTTVLFTGKYLDNIFDAMELCNSIADTKIISRICKTKEKVTRKEEFIYSVDHCRLECIISECYCWPDECINKTIESIKYNEDGTFKSDTLMDYNTLELKEEVILVKMGSYTHVHRIKNNANENTSEVSHMVLDSKNAIVFENSKISYNNTGSTVFSRSIRNASTCINESSFMTYEREMEDGTISTHSSECYTVKPSRFYHSTGNEKYWPGEDDTDTTEVYTNESIDNQMTRTRYDRKTLRKVVIGGECPDSIVIEGLNEDGKNLYYISNKADDEPCSISIKGYKNNDSFFMDFQYEASSSTNSAPVFFEETKKNDKNDKVESTCFMYDIEFDDVYKNFTDALIAKLDKNLDSYAVAEEFISLINSEKITVKNIYRGEYSIYERDEKSRLIRSRLWTNTDHVIFDWSEYISLNIPTLVDIYIYDGKPFNTNPKRHEQYTRINEELIKISDEEFEYEYSEKLLKYTRSVLADHNHPNTDHSLVVDCSIEVTYNIGNKKDVKELFISNLSVAQILESVEKMAKE